MAPEPASEKQRHYLCGLLKARGVGQADCESLISTVFPQGLTKQDASAEIDQMKYMSGLPARWIHAYVRQLRQRHAIPIDALLKHLQVAFDGATQPAGLSRLQQQDLIAWLCHPDRRTPSDQSQAP
jgi:hypothetical protein